MGFKFDLKCINVARNHRGPRVVPIVGFDMPEGMSRMVGAQFVAGVDMCEVGAHNWGPWFGASLDGGLMRDCDRCGSVQGARRWGPSCTARHIMWAAKWKAAARRTAA